MDTREITNIYNSNLKIQKTMNASNNIWERVRLYRIEWTSYGRISVFLSEIKNSYFTSFKIKNGVFIAYGNIENLKIGEEYYKNGVEKVVIKNIVSDQCVAEKFNGRIIYED